MLKAAFILIQVALVRGACEPGSGEASVYDEDAAGNCVFLPTITVGTSEGITTAMSASAKVKEFTGSSGMGTSFAAAKTIYTGSVLETLAKTSWAGAADFDLFATYYGSPTWLHDYMLTALDGTGQFEGELAPTTRGDMVAARTEAAKKAAQDQILMMACISSLQADYMVDANWDLAYAYWHGDNNGGAPYARANKRCGNYGTCAADGATAKANFVILEAIAAGKAAVAETPPNAQAAAAAYNTVRAAAYGVYYQAAARYGYKMDKALTAGGATADYQGEGGAFWRVIAPLLNARDADLSKHVSDFYTMTNAPSGVNSRYCTLEYLLLNNLMTGFTRAEFGSTAAPGALLLAATTDQEAGNTFTCMSGITTSGLTVGAPATVSAALTTAASASAKVKEFTGSSGMGTNFAAAKTIYTGSVLETLAKQQWTGNANFDMFATYFGSTTWLHDYMLTALDGTGQFEGELAPTTRGPMSEARTEAAKKAAQDQILVNAAINEITTKSDTATQWFLFYAYWTGDNPGGAPWARANKRCQNYGTCGGDKYGGDSYDGEIAKVNSQMLLAVLSALGAPADSTTTTAVGLAKIVYWQAALRYGWKIDDALTLKPDADPPKTTVGATADYQGEGGAFWRVIAPMLNAVDPTASAYTTNFYNMDTTPVGTNHYCPLKATLHANLPAGMTSAEMGIFEKDLASAPYACATAVTKDTAGAQKTTLVIVAPGVASDYVAADIAGTTAATLGVLPTQVMVSIAAASRRARHRLLSTGGVTITITVYSADATAATAIETGLTNMAGTASAASTFLTQATGSSKTVSAAPAAPTSEAAKSSSGLSTGALVGIIIGAIVGVVVIGGGVFFVMKKKKQAKGVVVTKGAVSSPSAVA